MTKCMELRIQHERLRVEIFLKVNYHLHGANLDKVCLHANIYSAKSRPRNEISSTSDKIEEPRPDFIWKVLFLT